jgi:hypothetical protein
MRQKIKAVYFSDSEAEILEWVEGKNSFSGYIKDLVRLDMEIEEKGVDPRVKAMVAQMLDSRLAGMATNTKTPITGGDVEVDSLLAGIFS